MAKMRPYEIQERNKRIEYEGMIWHIDAKAFYRPDGTGVLRVYRVDGDITKPDLLKEALEAEASSCGLSSLMIGD